MNHQRIYNSIIEKRKIIPACGYTETHHILPRCLGGTDSKDNLVLLTAKEHYICHLLLTKMFQKGSNEYYKICYAFLMMTVSSYNHTRIKRSATYEHIRKELSVWRSTKVSGSNNPMYGNMWIHSVAEERNCIIPKNAEIPQGWVKGRKIKFNKYLCKHCSTEVVSYGKVCGDCRAAANRKNACKGIAKVKRRCSINGVVYDSVADAARDLGIKQATVQFRIYSKNFETYMYLD